MDEPQDLNIGDWTLKIRVPAGPGPHPVAFLIHGWTGDEKSMWVFASRLPRSALLVAPRAPYVSRHPQFGGYSWVQERGQSFSNLEMFQPAIDMFEILLPELGKHAKGNFEQFSMVGFSQGAAFSFAFAMRNSGRVNRLASLAGFLPSESHVHISALVPVPIFIAHGTQDETVPVTMARSARSDFETAGVKVSYCESETGHKLGADCAKQLSEFFKPS